MDSSTPYVSLNRVNRETELHGVALHAFIVSLLPHKTGSLTIVQFL
jgi:hypothetical protein